MNTHVDTEAITRASVRIKESAESLSRSAGYLQEITDRHYQRLEELVTRFEIAVEQLKSGQQPGGK